MAWTRNHCYVTCWFASRTSGLLWLLSASSTILTAWSASFLIPNYSPSLASYQLPLCPCLPFAQPYPHRPRLRLLLLLLMAAYADLTLLPKPTIITDFPARLPIRKTPACFPISSTKLRSFSTCKTRPQSTTTRLIFQPALKLFSSLRLREINWPAG